MRGLAVALKGAAAHANRLRRMRNGAAGAVARNLYLAGQEIELEAERSITEGSISGKNHVPSVPGEAPNADTRRLDTSIDTTLESRSPPTVHVTSNAPYSEALEFGTSKMVERPFMRPAARKKAHRVTELVGQAVRTVVR